MLRKVSDITDVITVLEIESYNLIAVYLRPHFQSSPKEVGRYVLKPCLLPFRQDLEVAAEFSITSGLTCLLEALKKRNYVKVRLLALGHFSSNFCLSLGHSDTYLTTYFTSRFRYRAWKSCKSSSPVS